MHVHAESTADEQPFSTTAFSLMGVNLFLLFLRLFFLEEDEEEEEEEPWDDDAGLPLWLAR